MSGAAVLESAIAEPVATGSLARCQVCMWFHPCERPAAWLVTRHDCPRRMFGNRRAAWMLKRVGSDRIVRSGDKVFRACDECRAELQAMFALGPIHCWGCLRRFDTYTAYYPAEVKMGGTS